MNRYFSAKIALLLFLAACLKPPPEMPPYTGHDDPGLPVNGDLGWLNLQSPAAGSNPILLDSDITIAAIIRADDSSGNLYDCLILEDSNGGIMIRINSSPLYKAYPTGRKIYLKLKGLYLGNNHGLPCLGATPTPDNAGLMQVSSLPARMISRHIIPAGFPPPMPARETNLQELIPLNPGLLNRLVRIPELELVNPGYDRTYAEPERTAQIRLRDCLGREIILRTSNYALFRDCTTPSGKGSLTAVYSVYDNTPQLIIRDTADLQFYDRRCDGSSAANSITIPIDSIRRIYRNKDTLLAGLAICGLVITDADSRNHGASGSMIVQDATGGIIIYFGSAAANVPVLGDSVRIDLQGSTLTRYNGGLEIKNIKTSAAQVIASGKTAEPVRLNIATLNARFEQYESMLVRIDNARITNPGNFSGNRMLNDGSGSIILFTSSLASFARQPAPAISKTFQGIVTWYDTVKEIKIRNPVLDVY